MDTASDAKPVESATTSHPDRLTELDRLLSLCEVQSIRSGVPLLLGAHIVGNGVNFAIFSRHAIGVRLDLFAAVQDAMPVRTVVLNPLRNKTGDIWHVWLEGVGSGQLYGFRVAGPYNPDEGQRFKCGQAGNRSLRNRRKLSALLL